MKTTLILTACILCAASTASFAADEFGARFTDQAPAGLSDSPLDETFNMDDFDPNSIEPAAGDEQDSDAPENDPSVESEIDQSPSTQDAPAETQDEADEISL